ncbi:MULTISPECIES: SUMF1/EgtB/PvdO family nonheme iron enzyme [Nostoc]|uniref:SUMF1/EgtB/PvdO family nonheme iron enzyme n=2 Tax=Nostoc TaxID=1177 RepID=A0ABR8I2C0_9NOSO|nr:MULTISPECIES: SUMF1/EgtB/PvdO family nonheme iron enzyme [Nostoc]MBD2560091.1 SUMF1/EgtB/PvdO family nonheme iron enzyme [Nostoc linckia FACHB-391]MBD2645751.1 SUMF1/EgtB/PvdO family nonheme iron enzyme [Nostoc foliaceum FACHB-393]
MAEDAVRVFISYSHKDEHLRDSLATHLSNLQWQGIISSWYDRQLTAGTEWDDKIKTELESADIILLLISPDFIASKYCRDIEIPMALQRHESKQAYVVPVILRPFDWFDAPFAKLQAFPKDAKAVTSWENRDEAFVTVTQGIRTAAKQMLDYRKQLAEQKQVIQAQYLQKVEEVLSDGVISIVERDTLDELRESLGLTPEEAKEIETRAYEPYSRVVENLNKYKQTLNKLIEKGYYPFSEEIEKDLENRQRDLGLKPEDVARISKPILDQAELDYQGKRNQLEVEQLKSLEQRRQQEEYEAKLQRYREEFSRAVQVEYPLSQPVVEGLKNFRQQLGLKNGDFAQIERSIREPAEARYQEKLKEYEAKLQRYRQEFSRVVEVEYPLSQPVVEGLRNFQQQLGLKNEDFAQIERSIREPAEARYQEKLKQQAEAERQRQIELEQRKQAEAKHKAQEKASSSQASSPQNSADTKLQRFQFDVITFDKQGNENSRTRKAAEFFSENLGKGVLLEMVKIPSGAFQMGSPEGKGDNNEKPQHTVRVLAFLIGKYPVTQAQWRAVAALPQVKIALNAQPSRFKGDSRPVEKVSWDEAVEFCQRLSVVTGHSYRLPSEAEWEYACRAGTTTEFYFGETLTPKLAPCKANLGMALLTMFGGETASVGSYLPNAFGLYDMHGNVWEWCADHWHDNYVSAPTDGTAWTVNGNSEKRIVRGGSWIDNPAYCGAATRFYVSPAVRDDNVGFRVVC